MGLEKKVKILNPTIIKLGLVSFFADVASEMLYPITPIFLATILGSSYFSIGLIEGSAEAIASLLKVYSGYFSDRFSKRKPFVVAGYTLSAIAKPLIGLTSSWTGVLFARGLDRTGKGIRTAPRDAMISDTVEKQHAGEAFGWHRAMDTAGAALGPLITISLIYFLKFEIQDIFIYSIVPGLLSILLTLSLREKSTNPSHQPKNTHKLRDQFLLTNKTFKKFIFAWSIFIACNSSDVFLILKAKQVGLSTTKVILAYCFYNLVYALLSPSLGFLADKFSKAKILACGLFIFSFVYIGFSLTTSEWQVWLLFTIYGFYMAATDGVSKAFALELTSPSNKATTLGLLGAITGFCTLFASAAAGLLWDTMGSASTFIFGATGAIIAATLLILIDQKKSSLEIPQSCHLN